MSKTATEVEQEACPFRLERITSEPISRGTEGMITVSFKTGDGLTDEQWRQAVRVLGPMTPHQIARALRLLADNLELFGNKGYKDWLWSGQ